MVLLFATGEWTRLIPTLWSIFPAAWQTFLTYATFHVPQPRRMQHLLGRVIHLPLQLLSWKTRSRQEYQPADISPYFIVNGYPPKTAEYQRLLDGGFAEWRLEIRGLVKHPQHWSLEDLRAFPPTSQITKHHLFKVGAGSLSGRACCSARCWKRASHYRRRAIWSFAPTN